MQMILSIPAFPLRILAALCLACWAMAHPAAAADRERVEAFLEVTGFDVALDSIALSASSAPDMLGVDAGAFGSQWTEMSEEVFDTTQMRGLALDILESTLDDEALDHAAAFYASDLGKRLVRAENSSHLVEDDEVKQLAGNRIISDLVKAGSKRVAMYQRMGSAIDAAGTGVKALQQIQFRFLMAAAAAGVIELELDADELRALMKDQEGELRLSLQASSLAAAAYTYQEFTDAEVQAYVEALEEAPMQRVYELLNAVQYEITANRFEELAHRMAELTPGEDI
ncbi:DUF2059 domain-containing protein [Leisingera aquaemixtae]|uniref:DUF2059 domain-containing protein n=1 Tax=Leisingera aquaemixtae TaxID=1396826 RepID=UPI001C93FBDD|nr:DUF2059 domain-containing protein [Leisingera aquaemixtae]MBY6065677.1 DUF2059 domain-containing protein [Leisingera aquaemixtae]